MPTKENQKGQRQKEQNVQNCFKQQKSTKSYDWVDSNKNKENILQWL